jgi:hypothetical protein
VLDVGASGDGVVAVALAVLVALAAGLLVPAGIAKLRDPAVARRALDLPRRAEPAVRLLGVGELVLAIAVLATGAWPLVAALALTYAGFTVVASRQRARGASCGCFGASRTPTGWHHVLLDGAAALVTATAAVVGVTPAAGLVTTAAPLTGVLLAATGAVAVVTLQQLITTLPDLAVARRTAGGSS